MSADEKIVTDPTSKGWVLDPITGYYSWTGGSNMGPIQDGDTDGQVTTWSDSAQEWTPDSTVVVSGGNVGIGNAGTVTPSGQGASLVVDTGKTDDGMTIVGSNSASIFFADAAEARAGRILYLHSTDEMSFYTNGNAKRLTIDASGNATFSGRVDAPIFGCDAGGEIRFADAGNQRVSRILNDGVAGTSRMSFEIQQGGGGFSKALEIDASGDATFSGTIEAKGFGCRAGLVGPRTDNKFNIQWGNIGGAAELWIDSTRVGTISTTTRTAQDLIKTLTTLRQATMDETQDIRESLRSAIDELVEGFEQEISTMPVDDEPEAMDD